MINLERDDDKIILKANFGNKFKVYIRYVGAVNDKDFNSDIIKTKLNSLFSGFDNYSLEELEKYIDWIKFIFKDLSEESLLFTLNINDYCGCLVEYKNNELIRYISHDTIDNSVQFRFSYDKDLGISNGYTPVKDRYYFEEYDKFIKNEIKNISNLLSNSRLKFSYDEEALIKMYQIFYHENPNFMLNSTRVKAQVMVSMLKHYNISLGSDYYFMVDSGGFINSLLLDKLINRLKSFGVIDDSLISINFIDYYEKVIEMVGKQVRDYFNNDMELLNSRLSSLNDVAVLQHVCVHNMPSNFNTRMLSNYLDLSDADIDSKLKVLKKIENKIK